MFGNIGNFADLMRNAGRVREMIGQATESLGRVQVEGTAGGGAVLAKVNGRLELTSLRIEPKLLADGDAELLEDLVVSAVNQGLSKAREAGSKVMQEATGLTNLPGLDSILAPDAGGGGSS